MSRAWWDERVGTLRRGPGSDGYDGARAELDAEFRRVSRSHPRFRSWRADLGDSLVDDASSDVIHGCATRTAKLQPALRGTSAAVRLELEDWRAGVLDRLEAASVEEPLAYFRRALENRLVELKRREKRLVHPASADSDEDESGELLEGVAGPTALPWNPYSVPRDVARTLRDAAVFHRILIALAPSLRDDHALRKLVTAAAKELQRSVAEWATLSDFVRDDVARGAERHRWTPDVRPALDNHVRAWLAAYYEYEQVDDHWDPSEMPAYATHPAYQHRTRFRGSYTRAVQTARGIVDHGDEAPLRDATHLGKRAIPSEWDATEHKTLRAGDDR